MFTGSSRHQATVSKQFKLRHVTDITLTNGDRLPTPPHQHVTAPEVFVNKPDGIHILLISYMCQCRVTQSTERFHMDVNQQLYYQQFYEMWSFTTALHACIDSAASTVCSTALVYWSIRRNRIKPKFFVNAQFQRYRTSTHILTYGTVCMVFFEIGLL